MYEDLNQIQIDILEYLMEHIKKNGYPPSIREIMKAVDLKSTSTVHKHMCILEDLDYIRKDSSKPRAIEIIGDYHYKDEVLAIPLVGNVTAGIPVLASENIDEVYTVSSKLIDENDFILRVNGESMINAGIYNRDYIIVRKQNYAKNGDIVVALIEEDATLKRFYKEKDHIRLQPENDAMEAIIVEDLIILGVVKGVYRKL